MFGGQINGSSAEKSEVDLHLVDYRVSSTEDSNESSVSSTRLHAVLAFAVGLHLAAK